MMISKATANIVFKGAHAGEQCSSGGSRRRLFTSYLHAQPPSRGAPASRQGAIARLCPPCSECSNALRTTNGSWQRRPPQLSRQVPQSCPTGSEHSPAAGSALSLPWRAGRARQLSLRRARSPSLALLAQLLPVNHFGDYCGVWCLGLW